VSSQQQRSVLNRDVPNDLAPRCDFCRLRRSKRIHAIPAVDDVTTDVAWKHLALLRRDLLRTRGYRQHRRDQRQENPTHVKST
jgi:hypothetical protein